MSYVLVKCFEGLPETVIGPFDDPNDAALAAAGALRNGHPDSYVVLELREPTPPGRDGHDQGVDEHGRLV